MRTRICAKTARLDVLARSLVALPLKAAKRVRVPFGAVRKVPKTLTPALPALLAPLGRTWAPPVWRTVLPAYLAGGAMQRDRAGSAIAPSVRWEPTATSLVPRSQALAFCVPRVPTNPLRRLRSWPSASLVLWETSRTKWELRAVRDVLKAPGVMALATLLALHAQTGPGQMAKVPSEVPSATAASHLPPRPQVAQFPPRNHP